MINGEMLGNHRQMLKGPQLYEDLAHVPLIARWPRTITAGSEITELVQWIDLPATILQAASCTNDTGGQGQSLLPLTSGENSS